MSLSVNVMLPGARLVAKIEVAMKRGFVQQIREELARLVCIDENATFRYMTTDDDQEEILKKHAPLDLWDFDGTTGCEVDIFYIADEDPQPKPDITITVRVKGFEKSFKVKPENQSCSPIELFGLPDNIDYENCPGIADPVKDGSQYNITPAFENTQGFYTKIQAADKIKPITFTIIENEDIGDIVVFYNEKNELVGQYTDSDNTMDMDPTNQYRYCDYGDEEDEFRDTTIKVAKAALKRKWPKEVDPVTICYTYAKKFPKNIYGNIARAAVLRAGLGCMVPKFAEPPQFHDPEEVSNVMLFRAKSTARPENGTIDPHSIENEGRNSKFAAKMSYRYTEEEGLTAVAADPITTQKIKGGHSEGIPLPYKGGIIPQSPEIQAQGLRDIAGKIPDGSVCRAFYKNWLADLADFVTQNAAVNIPALKKKNWHKTFETINDHVENIGKQAKPVVVAKRDGTWYVAVVKPLEKGKKKGPNDTDPIRAVNAALALTQPNQGHGQLAVRDGQYACFPVAQATAGTPEATQPATNPLEFPQAVAERRAQSSPQGHEEENKTLFVHIILAALRHLPQNTDTFAEIVAGKGASKDWAVNTAAALKEAFPKGVPHLPNINAQLLGERFIAGTGEDIGAILRAANNWCEYSAHLDRNQVIMGLWSKFGGQISSAADFTLFSRLEERLREKYPKTTAAEDYRLKSKRAAGAMLGIKPKRKRHT